MTNDYVTLLRQSDDKNFGGGASDEDIVEAEKQLNVKMPPDYELFLREFGWGGTGAWEIYGLGSDVPIYLDLVRMTKTERTEAFPPIKSHLLPIMNDGFGNHYCLDLRRNSTDEYSVVYWDHEASVDQNPEEVSPSFASWILDKFVTSAEIDEIED